MCFTCTLEEVTGIDSQDLVDGWTVDEVRKVQWPAVTDEMKLLARLRWVLYECTSACTGGPMHIFTDDYNVEDSNLDFCEKEALNDTHWGVTDYPDWPLVKAVTLRMCELARPMSEAERAVALSLSWGELQLDASGKVVVRP
jgi:hypothetical protein